MKRGESTVGSSIFGRWLGRSATEVPEVTDAVAALDELTQARPSLQTAATVLRQLLPQLFVSEEGELSLLLTPEAARAKLTDGLPLLRGEIVTPDRKEWRRRWLAICDTLAQHQGGAATVADAVRCGTLEPSGLLGEALAGHAAEVHARADALGLDAALTATVLRLVSYPALAHLAARLAPLRETATWEHGYCPTCGSWPLLGEFRGLDQTRLLRCGLCATAWPFARLRCSFCDNRDHRQLGYLHVDGEQDSCRAATCDACRGYVKMVFTLESLSAPRLLVTDLTTLHLDLAAAERGYFVP
jgi:FdhE protein